MVLYLAHETHTRVEGQPPVQYEHEVVTGDGEVDTLLQATLRKKICKDEELRRAKQKSANYTSFAARTAHILPATAR